MVDRREDGARLSLSEFIRFLGVGGANTLATGALFLMLSYPLPATVAYTIAFGVGILGSIWVTPRLVFRAPQASINRRAAYAAWYVLVYLVGLGLTYLLNDRLRLERLAVVGLTVACTASISFLGAQRLFATRNLAPPRGVSRASSGSWGRVDVWIVVGLIAAGAILPLVTSAVAGTLEIPRNDDWSYRRIAVALASTGRLEMDGAAETMLVGQVVLTQPLLWLSDGDAWAFTVAGFGFAIGAIVGAYVLARQILPPARAGLAALLLALFPGYLAYATSYMNDVPALAAQFLTVGLGAVALSRRPIHYGWLVAAAVVGCLAFSMRHFALAAPAVILVAAICAEPKSVRTWGIALATAAVAMGLQLFRSSLPGQLGEVDRNLLVALRLPSAVVTVSLVVVPAAIVGAAISAKRWRPRDLAIGALVGLGLAAVPVGQWLWAGTFPAALLRNLVTQWGAPERFYVTGGRPILFPDAVWTAVNLLALVAVVIVAAVAAGVAGVHLRARDRSLAGLVRSAGSPRGAITLFTLLAAGGLAVFGLFFNVYDRYLWPIVPPLAALLMVDSPAAVPSVGAPVEPAHLTRRVWAAALVGCVLLAAFALPFMANSHAFDAARWQAGERLVASGVPPNTIDAGYEWVGFHATEQATPTDTVPTRIWYLSWWRNFQLCGLARSGEISPPDGVPVGKVTYRLGLVIGPVRELWLYTIDSPMCRQAAAPT